MGRSYCPLISGQRLPDPGKEGLSELRKFLSPVTSRLNPVLMQEIASELLSQAEAVEQNRCVDQSMLEKLREAGLCRALVPARYGGWESRFLPILEQLVDIGSACASTAWVASLFASHSLIAAWFPETAQDAVWSESPDTLIGSSLAPMGELWSAKDGFALKGEWSFSSGIDHAEWLILGAKNEKAESVLVLVRASVVTVSDDWFVCGLKGTGSKSLSIQETAVPAAFVLPMSVLESGQTPGHEVNKASVFRFPWRPAFSFSFVPTALGVAQQALQTSRSYLSDRSSAYTGKKFVENPVGWVQLAESASEIETAMSLLHRDVGQIENALAEGGAVSKSLVLRASYTPALIVKLCRQAVNRLFHISGATALYENRQLERNFRDTQAIGQHPGVNIDIAGQAYGRGLLENPEYKVGEDFGL